MSIVNIVFPAPVTPYMELCAYSDEVTPETLAVTMFDMKREATSWARSLTNSSSRKGLKVVNENLYTREKRVTESAYSAIRNASEFVSEFVNF